MSPFCAISQATMEPTWRKEEIGKTFSFFVTSEELDSEGYVEAVSEAQKTQLQNIRVFTPAMLEWASIFHPSFFHAISLAHPNLFESLKLCAANSQTLQVANTHYWLSSNIFLAGVTLSAAIIQRRFSTGTLSSKLDKLWQAGELATKDGLTEIQALNLQTQVQLFSQQLDQPNTALLGLKQCFSEVISKLANCIPVEAEEINKVELDSAMTDRFGFRNELAELIGPKLKCIIVYGSSVTSKNFSDYDVIVITSDRNEALQKLRKKAPQYRGVEINLSVFETEEFWNYQKVSGDNLSHHGLCIFGSAIIPKKSSADLLARNYSFGFIRLRQLIGMASPSPLSGTTIGRDSLHSYFAKIPLNVAKGILGSWEITVSKEELLSWACNSLNYSPSISISQIETKGSLVMAYSAWATHRTMTLFNEQYCICAPSH